MLEIKVLGPGCANCQDLERRVKQALSELEIQAKIEKVADLKEISKYIMMTPGLVINEKVVHSGKPLPKIEKIKEWIKASDAPKEDVSKRKGGCACGCCDCGE
jgi:small redox-active disulfide protein 2